MVPSTHGPHAAKYLTTVFGDHYVQNVYIQCVLQRWKRALIDAPKYEMSLTLGIEEDLMGNNPVISSRVISTQL